MNTRNAYIWSLDDIRIRVVDGEGDELLLAIDTPAGTMELIGRISVDGRTLSARGVHIQGLAPGALGRSGLNAIGRKLLVEADVDRIIVEGGTRTTGRRRGARPPPFKFP